MCTHTTYNTMLFIGYKVYSCNMDQITCKSSEKQVSAIKFTHKISTDKQFGSHDTFFQFSFHVLNIIIHFTDIESHLWVVLIQWNFNDQCAILQNSSVLWEMTYKPWFLPRILQLFMLAMFTIPLYFLKQMICRVLVLAIILH